MEVKLGREYYSAQAAMVDWCERHIGPGGWKNSPMLLFPNQTEWVWTVESLFGYTTFVFKRDEDAKWFIDQWL